LVGYAAGDNWSSGGIGLTVGIGGYVGEKVGKTIGEPSGTYVADQVNEYYE
jgi:hypothetical protein